MKGFSRELAEFTAQVKFNDLPSTVVHEGKRLLLDSIGCALGGHSVDKGRISVELARRLGGPDESSIIGTSDKVSCASAAFANAELINALDYDALLYPAVHVTPYVLSGPMAIAQSNGASGRDLILAIVLGHEIALRIALGLSPMQRVVKEGDKEFVKIAPVFGQSQFVFGGTAAACKMLGLDSEKICHALGLAGHTCSVGTMMKWAETTPSTMTKYGSGGWVSMGGVLAALWAQLGYIGDTTVFEGDFGFWRFFASEGWDPAPAMKEIGQKWYFLDNDYKPYPCCRLCHSVLDALLGIMKEQHLSPEEVESVKAFGSPWEEKPPWKNNDLKTHVDAQFSEAYIVAVAATGVAPGIDWQLPETMEDPRIKEFMKKVNSEVHPRLAEEKRKDPKSMLGSVEIVARGKTFAAERLYPRWTSVPEVAATDEELIVKFRNLASSRLEPERIEEVVDCIMNLESLDQVSSLFQLITP